MFLSLDQIQESLGKLQAIHPFYGTTFLACKRANLPVGRMVSFPISTVETQILDDFYRPDVSSDYFYRVFNISDKSRRWMKRDKYSSSTLQSIRTRGPFSKPFIHEPNTDKWGWQSNYISELAENLSKNLPPYRGKRVPVFDLAVWLYRSRDWPRETTGRDVISFFLSDFHIEESERDSLFDLSIPDQIHDVKLFEEQSITWKELQRIIGYPPDSKPEEGAALQILELRGVGPADTLRYEPAERLNLITGDNGLGKTFILEAIWWSLTGEWLDYPALPRSRVAKSRPRITFAVGSSSPFTSDYSWETQTWKIPSKRSALPGLVIYARYDGSFAVWDPARMPIVERDSKSSKRYLFFERKDIWDGLQQGQWICNGLIRDWVSWQTGGERYREHYHALVACLNTLSPSENEPLIPGQPTRVSVRDARDFPTIRMFGDEIPVVLTSAGIQRIIAFAYLLVWAWQEHLANSQLARQKPQRRIVLLVDEIEAHLHPRWQRTIVPALINVVSQLEASVSPQIHVATHSPMVMASAETVFDTERDNLHHLRLLGQNVLLEELPFVKRGRADLWLMSDVFNLQQPRSLPAELAIKAAIDLQKLDSPSPDDVKKVNRDLVQVLAPDDEFWPRWRFFAKRFGVD
jgi:hypothetical protein